MPITPSCRRCSISVPPLVLSDGAILKLPHSGLQNLAGIIGKVQVSDLRQGHRHNSKGFLVLFRGTCANLSIQEKKAILKCAPTFDSFMLLCEQRWVRADLQHNWTFLLYINGNIGACNPGVGAEVP